MGEKSCSDCADKEQLSIKGSTCSSCVERIDGVYQLTHKNWKPHRKVEKDQDPIRIRCDEEMRPSGVKKP